MTGPVEILNYVIIRKIGEGGMGQVFLARNKSINQLVAIKMLHPRFGNNPALRERFRQEAIMLSSLNHPNIVKFLNYVENDQGIFLIMEYVEGMTLEDFINKKNGLIVESKAVPMINQILDAFEYAHRHGVVHRDIKPSNILLGNDGSIKVLDFGIAQIISESGEAESTRAGSIEYMSPEQARGQHLDTRSDIYSLGVLLYQMLTGRAPYDINSLSPIEIKRSIVEFPLERMKNIYPHVSDGMQYVVDQATQKNPSRRFRSCKDMKTCINRVATQNEAGTAENVKPSKTTSSKKGLIISMCAALAVVIVGGIGIWLYLRNSTRYYTDYIENSTLPAGLNVGKTEKGDPRYRLEYSKGKLTKVMLVDEEGNRTAATDSIYALYHPAEVEYLYKDNGDLDSRKVFDANGDLLYELKYEDGLYSASIERAKADTSRYRSVKLTFDPQGKIEKINYENADGKKVSFRGVYGESFEYDKNGRLSRITYLDANDKPALDKRGVAIVSFNYGKGSNNVKSSFFDLNGKPVTPAEVKVASSTGKKAAPKGRGKHARHRDEDSKNRPVTPPKKDTPHPYNNNQNNSSGSDRPKVGPGLSPQSKGFDFRK